VRAFIWQIQNIDFRLKSKFIPHFYLWYKETWHATNTTVRTTFWVAKCIQCLTMRTYIHTYLHLHKSLLVTPTAIFLKQPIHIAKKNYNTFSYLFYGLHSIECLKLNPMVSLSKILAQVQIQMPACMTCVHGICQVWFSIYLVWHL